MCLFNGYVVDSVPQHPEVMDIPIVLVLSLVYLVLVSNLLQLSDENIVFIAHVICSPRSFSVVAPKMFFPPGSLSSLVRVPLFYLVLLHCARVVVEFSLGLPPKFASCN